MKTRKDEDYYFGQIFWPSLRFKSKRTSLMERLRKFRKGIEHNSKKGYKSNNSQRRLIRVSYEIILLRANYNMITQEEFEKHMYSFSSAISELKMMIYPLKEAIKSLPK